MIDIEKREQKEQEKKKTRQRMQVKVDPNNYEFSPAQKETDYYDLYIANSEYSSFTVWTTRVSNPVCSPHFRASASVKAQQAAFATGVPPDIYAFHRYTGNSACLYSTQDRKFQMQFGG